MKTYIHIYVFQYTHDTPSAPEVPQTMDCRALAARTSLLGVSFSVCVCMCERERARAREGLLRVSFCVCMNECEKKRLRKRESEKDRDRKRD